MRKKASVRRTFYRSFCLLIVLPLVAVAAAGSALLYRKLLAASAVQWWALLRLGRLGGGGGGGVFRAHTGRAAGFAAAGAFPSFRRQRGPCSGGRAARVIQPPV